MRVPSGTRALLALALVGAVLVTFGGVLGHDFVNYDDDLYVTRNPAVQRGVGLESLRWAFTTGVAANWHPLTWLSHQLDWTLWGPAPGGHHATSLALHAANTLLVFVVLDRLTGAPWRSALVAALFGLHPLHVESVAWVAERKGVLSTLFWLLATLAWAGWARRGGAGRYALVAGALALGLLAKPMVVTLPFTLLLLDWWPLGRWACARAAWPLVREKLPLFALVAASAVVTWTVQQAGGAVTTTLPLATRLGNALVVWVAYLGKALWPVGLSPIYPHPGARPSLAVLAAALLLAAITALAVVQRRRRPHLLVGWLWYLGTLVPVIGLVQVGATAMADRYTYVPLLGIFVALAWSLPARPEPRLVGAAAVVVLALLGVRARDQAAVWRDSTTLFTHALAVDERNPLAHVNLGVELGARGELDRATAHLERALALRPDMVTARIALGNTLVRRGRWEEAVAAYRAALAADPSSARAHNNLGWVLLQRGQLDEAIATLERARQLDPALATAENDLGLARARRGDAAAARRHFEAAIALDPRLADAHSNLAAMLLQDGRAADAVAHATRAVELQPALAEAHANRVVGLARLGRYAEAWAAVHAARAAGVPVPGLLVQGLAQRMPDPGR